MKHFGDSVVLLMTLGLIILLGASILSLTNMLVPDDSLKCHLEWPLLLDKANGILRPAIRLEGNTLSECRELARKYPEAKIVIDN